ncbi:hypothetical protein ACFXDH_22080 [Streptomyces sp. NPDC059467]|uniref:hypothetical protein n=1 Tax=Streptomyces sp. NPDC059467 TaxID=3346844 RepID=UPI003682C061
MVFAARTAPSAIAAIRDLLGTFGTGVDDDTAVLAINVPRSTSDEQQRAISSSTPEPPPAL